LLLQDRRSISCSAVEAKGEQRNGTFVVTEPRPTFYVPEDREVTVYFEREGSKGIHHREGSVRGPDGQFTTMSSFDNTATQPRFAGFWHVPLSDSSPQCNWTFESRVDGEQAGQLAFQVVASAKPANLVKPAALPTPAGLYKRATSASVFVENLDDHGHLRLFHEGWNRRHVHRMIEGAHGLNGMPSLQLAGAKTWTIGDHWLTVNADNTRTLSDG
jgi:hypothetical protein